MCTLQTRWVSYLVWNWWIGEMVNNDGGGNLWRWILMPGPPRQIPFYRFSNPSTTTNTIACQGEMWICPRRVLAIVDHISHLDLEGVTCDDDCDKTVMMMTKIIWKEITYSDVKLKSPTWEAQQDQDDCDCCIVWMAAGHTMKESLNRPNPSFCHQLHNQFLI